MGPGRSRCVRRPREAVGLGQEHTETGLATIWAIIILAENNNHTFRYRAGFLTRTPNLALNKNSCGCAKKEMLTLRFDSPRLFEYISLEKRNHPVCLRARNSTSPKPFSSS
jgi:hypothetical protein